jgi:hypothetical protein
MRGLRAWRKDRCLPSHWMREASSRLRTLKSGAGVPRFLCRLDCTPTVCFQEVAAISIRRVCRLEMRRDWWQIAAAVKRYSRGHQSNELTVDGVSCAWRFVRDSGRTLLSGGRKSTEILSAPLKPALHIWLSKSSQLSPGEPDGNFSVLFTVAIIAICGYWTLGQFWCGALFAALFAPKTGISGRLRNLYEILMAAIRIMSWTFTRTSRKLRVS